MKMKKQKINEILEQRFKYVNVWASCVSTQDYKGITNIHGITLIALVITIIVLLILAGIVLNLTLGEHGILNKASQSGEEYRKAAAKEKVELMLADFVANGAIGDTLTLKEYLNNQKEQGKIEEVTNNGDGTITVKVDGYEITTPTLLQEGVSEPSNSNEIREGKELPFTWTQIAEIAKMIANNSNITNDTAEFNLVYEGEEYTIGVGDWTTVAYNGNNLKVRIMGFNHDELVDKTIYQNEDGRENTYAGISFEFVECFENGRLNNPNKGGGWVECDLRKRLNNSILNILENEKYIKEVSKQYVILDIENVPSSNDKLWLLSCSEIWDNGYEFDYGNYKFQHPHGFSIGKEGEQYKYYKNIDAISSTGDSRVAAREFRE